MGAGSGADPDSDTDPGRSLVLDAPSSRRRIVNFNEMLNQYKKAKGGQM